MLHQLTEFILGATTSVWAYALLAVLIIGDALIPAVPSESVVISMASLLVHEHPWLLPLLFLVSAGAAWCGDNIAYSVGRSRWLSGSSLWQRPRIAGPFAWTRDELFRRGATFIIVGRFIPGVRIVINLVCGVVGYSRRRYMRVVVVSSSLWALYCVLIGSLAGAWFADNPLIGILVAIAAGMVLGPIIDWMLRRTVLRGTPGPATDAVDPAPPEDAES
ncbi:DedA family protein [Raineyella sp. LH-20]|uniref:DedA family protein n=1 Tax=Raineyella sp. LH-20 TaxID=3081204 RepID=UPI002954F81F|nr:VTT domain-containing protein [Raineyella sp. LH-20]WOP18188.1 VTT domain-containing protein [Raineyella sp. LH-20]